MRKSKGPKLSPSQQQAYEGLRQGLEVGSVFRLWSAVGRGKSTILKKLQEETGAAIVDLRAFMNEAPRAHPLAIEESLLKTLRAAFRKKSLVLCDDIHLLDLGRACHFYPRAGYLNAVMMALCNEVAAAGRKVVFSTTNNLPAPAEERSYSFGIHKFTAEDYESVAAAWLGKKAAALEFSKIYRFAPKLNAHQLRAACAWIDRFDKITTDRFIEYLRSQKLASNVDLDEVQNVDLATLKGVDDVLRSLEINVALPLENDHLAATYSLRSKRGILLYGPPGTGKTTVGRALAHRLRGKFFLIDGTFIAGTDNFYARIEQVFEAAKDNAPSVIFVDDADAIFQNGEEVGLYRYLLTMLDGLESESAARICVMMTAMNVADLPPALVRSGRVELWLEMKLPTPDARAAILQELVASLPGELRPSNLEEIITATDTFTGADLKRLVEDTKALVAYDKSQKKEFQEPSEYYLQAVKSVRDNKARYAEALANAKRSEPNPFAALLRGQH